MEHYDFIALGGGSAGVTAARKVRAAGRRVALIDPTPIGGVCALHGCNPKKVLVRAIEVLHEVQHAGDHGIRTGSVKIDWNAVIDRKTSFTESVTERSEEALQRAGIDYIRAPARFGSPESLELGDRTLSFDGIVIATGSSPRRLTFPGAHHVMSSDQILELRTPPARLAVIGAGVVAFEFAHIFARLGSTVHVLIRGDGLLKAHDVDVVSHLVAHLEALGVDFRKGVEVRQVTPNPTSYDVHLTDGATIGADGLLNAAGRPANVEGLALDAANVCYSPRGVKVNEYLRSPGNARVFAAGDVHGEGALSPIANYEGALVAHNFLHGDEKRADYGAVPSAVFTVPALAAVGVTESEARERGLDIEVVSEDISDWTVYRIAGERPAYAKVIMEKRSGRVLGAHLFGPAAEESIHVFAMAMRYGLTREQLSDMLYVYPALTSAMQHLAPRSEG